MAFGLGFILGPGIGGALAGVTIDGRTGAVPCIVAAALSLVNFGWAWFGLKESLPVERRSTSKRRLSRSTSPRRERRSRAPASRAPCS